ncbi:MAG: radical SAM protein, partial [Pseudomonadota bacterium]|nr:radical SAM protein [Pseudomonadota bacterium]
HLNTGALDELTITTNGSQLEKHAAGLATAGVKRINVSLDTLQKDKFSHITRWGNFDKVMRGIDAAVSAGLDIKINCVALKDFNDDEIHDIIIWCGDRGFDLTFIEVMPMGDIGNETRLDQYWPLSMVRADLRRRWTLTETDFRTGGPARYWRIEETGGRIGFITPLTHNFCESCNRVRLTCTGTLYMCLGQHDHADLRTALRDNAFPSRLEAAIREAISRKPKGHDFSIDRRTEVKPIDRHMSVTGG